MFACASGHVPPRVMTSYNQHAKVLSATGICNSMGCLRVSHLETTRTEIKVYDFVHLANIFNIVMLQDVCSMCLLYLSCVQHVMFNLRNFMEIASFSILICICLISLWCLMMEKLCIYFFITMTNRNFQYCCSISCHMCRYMFSDCVYSR